MCYVAVAAAAAVTVVVAVVVAAVVVAAVVVAVNIVTVVVVAVVVVAIVTVVVVAAAAAVVVSLVSTVGNFVSRCRALISLSPIIFSPFVGRWLWSRDFFGNHEKTRIFFANNLVNGHVLCV